MTSVVIDPSPERLVIDFRPLGFHDVIVLGRYEYSSAHPQLEFHRHEHMIEICLLEKGQQVYVNEHIEQEAISLKAFASLAGLSLSRFKARSRGACAIGFRSLARRYTRVENVGIM